MKSHVRTRELKRTRSTALRHPDAAAQSAYNELPCLCVTGIVVNLEYVITPERAHPVFKFMYGGTRAARRWLCCAGLACAS